MILAVNIGNSNIRAGVGGERIIKSAALPIREFSKPGRFEMFIKQCLGAETGMIEGGVLSSVVPSLTPAVMELIYAATGIRPLRVDARNLGALDTRRYAGILGEDRACCCAGVLARYAPPFAVVDFGTAITVNVVNAEGEFLGGVILPGIRMSLNALAKNTALLPAIGGLSFDVPLIGRNMEECLASGALFGAACAVGGYIGRVRRETRLELPVIATGGNAPAVLPYCDFKAIHEPDLLLDSLLTLYAYKL